MKNLSSPDIQHKRKAVARWLLIGVAMLIIQILLGGITRLTGSGLSITEWKPILGAIPPLNEADWQSAFEKYQTIAQYKYLNAHFTLTDFKAIYFWEWLHREWARIGLAVVFAVGFIYFLVRRYFDQEMIIPFIILFALGGLQGAIGWIMVKSGLNDTDLYVSHIRLAVHFMMALLLLGYTLWFALKLIVPQGRRIVNQGVRTLTLIIIAVLCLQLTYGAFMAGLKAGPYAPTWPDINGAYLPGSFHRYGNLTFTGIAQYISHPIAVQFIHRTLAYLLTGLIIAWALVVARHLRNRTSLLAAWRKWPLMLVLVQVVLGIFTVLYTTHTVAGQFGVFELLAQAHQLVALFLLVSLIVCLYGIRGRKHV
jgi:cytochrome c oxidase assembly protein subunit 15